MNEPLTIQFTEQRLIDAVRRYINEPRFSGESNAWKHERAGMMLDFVTGLFYPTQSIVTNDGLYEGFVSMQPCSHAVMSAADKETN